MKIQEVILRALAKKITWWQAAEIIGITDRQMRRWHWRYKEYDYHGLLDRRLGKPSPKRVPLAVVEQIFAFYREIGRRSAKMSSSTARHGHGAPVVDSPRAGRRNPPRRDAPVRRGHDPSAALRACVFAICRVSWRWRCCSGAKNLRWESRRTAFHGWLSRAESPKLRHAPRGACEGPRLKERSCALRPPNSFSRRGSRKPIPAIDQVSSRRIHCAKAHDSSIGPSSRRFGRTYGRTSASI
jgi:hypothetical protein